MSYYAHLYSPRFNVKEATCIHVLASVNIVAANSVLPVVFRYTRAVGQNGKLTISMPYVDAFGGGIVITLAKTLLQGR